MTTITAFFAQNLVEKARGLIGKKPSPLFFQTRFGIHTFGMHYPIDVAILDDKQNVVAMKTSLQPNRIFLWNIKYKNVLELPAGKYRLKCGNKIRLILQ